MKQLCALRVFIALCLWLYAVTEENHKQVSQDKSVLGAATEILSPPLPEKERL
jgi:hypothetical protein